MIHSSIVELYYDYLHMYMLIFLPPNYFSSILPPNSLLTSQANPTHLPDNINTTVPHIRVARWYIFKPIIGIWVNFGGPWNG
jgi:hypothetical protein